MVTGSLFSTVFFFCEVVEKSVGILLPFLFEVSFCNFSDELKNFENNRYFLFCHNLRCTKQADND